MVSIDLNGKSILITGALGAIAEFVNRRLVEAGAHLLLTDIVPYEEAVARLTAWGLPESNWRYVQMNVTDQNEVGAVVKQLFEEFPGTDTVLGHAGGCAMHPFATTPAEEFDRIFEFNFQGQTRLARAVIGEWLRSTVRGHIVFTSSLVGGLPWPDLAAYTSAKAAVEMFARCLALEFANKGMRFNCIAPGHVAAGSSQKVYQEDPAYRSQVNRAIPLARLVRPESIADVMLWLCSELAQDVNGQVIKVDCGASIPKVG